MFKKFSLIFLLVLILLLTGCASARYIPLEIEETVEELREAVKKDPNNAKAHYDLGSKFLSLEKPDSAITHFRIAHGIDPDYSEAYYGEYCATLMKNDYTYPEEEEELKRIENMHGKALHCNPLFSRKLGCILVEYTDPRMMAAGTRFDELNKDITIEVYKIYMKPIKDFFTEDFQSSLEGFQYLIQIEENDVGYKYFISQIHSRLGNYEEALEYINEVQRNIERLLKKRGLGYIFRLNNLYVYKGYLYEKVKDYDRALMYYRKAYMEGGVKYIDLLRMANVYHKIGKFEKEKEQLKHAALMENSEGLCNYKLGTLYLEEGERKKAIEQLKEATEKSPNFPESYYRMAEVYESMGESKKAVGYYKDFLKRASKEYTEKIDTAKLKIKELD